MSESARELVSIADTIVTDGQATRWTGIIENELGCARQVQSESVGLKLREIEQAVMATFLHSQPTGHSAKTRDLMLLIGPCRSNKIDLEKGLGRWAHSSYWLDDAHMPEKEGLLPGEWRLGNRPNLTQMQSAAAAQISDDVVKGRLIEEIGKVKMLTSGASAAGVRVHTLPTKPRDIEDDGLFHYAVMLPSAASDSGKPSPEAKRFLDETTGPDKPRVFRNAVLLLAPSKDGLSAAGMRIRDYQAWEKVMSDLMPKNEEEKKQKGSVDIARLQTLKINLDKAKGHVPDAIRQAYCIVVTVSDKDDVHAFKIGISDDPHFETIKKDSRSRVRETAITAEALLPGGPYTCGKAARTSRRVKTWPGFTQLRICPRCSSHRLLWIRWSWAAPSTFVLSSRAGPQIPHMVADTSRRRALKDPAIDWCSPRLQSWEVSRDELLAPKALPELWSGDEITAQAVADYFNGKKAVQVDRGGFKESVTVPKASPEIVNTAIGEAVASGKVWLLSESASLLAEPIPAGVLTPASRLRVPPAPISAAAILPENLPAAWNDGSTTALAIATALSQQTGHTLPWKTVRDVIGGSLQARFIAPADGSAPWPCELPSAGMVKIKVAAPGAGSVTGATGGGMGGGAAASPNIRLAVADFEPSQIQDLGDLIPALLEIKAKAKISMKFYVRLEVGDGTSRPLDDVVNDINSLLKDLGEDFRVS